MFLFYVVAFRSRTCFGKIILTSGLPFGVSFFLFCSDVVSRDKAQVVTGHTPHRTFLVCLLFFCPHRACVITRSGRASFLSGVLSGCVLGPVRFCIFGILSELGGLEPTRPF